MVTLLFLPQKQGKGEVIMLRAWKKRKVADAKKQKQSIKETKPKKTPATIKQVK